MEFAEFAAWTADIESESADTAVCERVAALLRDAGPDRPVVVRFLLGRVFPAHESRTLDIGPKLCYEAIARAAGPNLSAADVEARLADVGDIGEVAASYDLGGQQGLGAFAGGGTRLTVAGVEQRLHDVASADGVGSQETKLDVLFGLFRQTDPEEAMYLARLVLSEMRIGVGEGTIRDGTAEAFDIPLEAVERALQVSNDYGLVAKLAHDGGRAALAEVTLTVGRPIQAMLAQTGTVSDAIEDWGTVAVEWKYDGARVQIHYDGDTIALYSRNMEDVTDALPEIVDTVDAAVSVPVILDGEVVAVDDAGEPRPFQDVLRRFRRKHDIAQAREDVRLRLHAFDCLHVAGEDLLDVPLTERHDRLVAVFETETPISELWLCDDATCVESIEDRALEAGQEGVMLKNPDAPYSPGRRGKNWRKRKPDVETLDLVVTGAEWGEGRRANLLGTFELSARSDDGYVTVGNVATGITDEQLEELTDLLEPHIRTETGTAVDIEPAIVFEVGYEEIQSSPSTASGYALRFPRFLGVRADKEPADADSRTRLDGLATQQRR